MGKLQVVLIAGKGIGVGGSLLGKLHVVLNSSNLIRIRYRFRYRRVEVGVDLTAAGRVSK